MTASELVALPAKEVLKRFKQKTLTPSDYLTACLSHIEQVNPQINALTAMDSDAAVKAAELATMRYAKGQPIGPLDGLPIGVKDLQDTKGLLTTHGSQRGRAYVPDADMPLVARLRAAGAIVLAKTNVPEMGAGGNSRNPVWGATANPFDANKLAGGSSGGSAAALAANLLPMCTGSDTGGSLRLPAALCGVPGYRPSVDVIAHPTRPVGWSGISVLGPMVRTIDDLLLMLDICQNADANDPLSIPAKAGRFGDITPRDLSGLRVGYSEDFGGAAVDQGIRETFKARVAHLAPHVKACVAVDMNLGDMDRVFDILRAESFVAAFDKGVQDTPEDFGPHIIENVELGQTFSLADRAWAHLEQTRILRKFNALMTEFDVILMPTVPVSPFEWTTSHPEMIDGTKMDIYYRWLALTYRGSLMGGPSITLPAGRDHHDMPFGLQLLGAVRGDEALLSIAKSVETLFAASPETARPVPDLQNIPPTQTDLRAFVTHPPIFKTDQGDESLALSTAV
ncbi:Asp-tRNA(Asn)/Glu-tRNA(Gln) amidotransferase A subunit family amidase [Pacificibacter maritimus]|uniref:Asp-tRNA(Asn)/Glu-tRNA(Gln) amidotransferase A subunit family amidase n=1 Tax=Pacificibacter maritimus TaxID=762213 RepID=A0A3N4U751_9RHOB|nr:amidase family protein [Pacificibacter maritimus]RPE62931.1 Asp-tRNA(Asn)/Glu-tRNA(Gln) amidotransferase A subunit family amidase [Pacificibacter maritimus]